MKSNRLTWAGLGVALIGWAVLIADMVVSDTVLKAGNLVAVLALRGDILTIAQTAIFSGFGLAVIGTLRSGFGAFAKFFDAVLQRSAAPPRPKEPVALDPEPMIDPAPAPSPVRPVDTITVSPVRPVDTITVSPAEPRPEWGKPTRTRDRNYVILSDGSVEVETMFGTRVFATMDEAKDFIR